MLKHNGHRKAILQAAIDMSPAYIKGVRENLRNAQIVFDKFHVLDDVNQAVDKVRRAESQSTCSAGAALAKTQPHVVSQRAGERVLTSLTTFLREKLKLTVNPKKSAVDRPWKRKFLGFSLTSQKVTKVRVAPQSVERFKDKLRGKVPRRDEPGT